MKALVGGSKIIENPRALRQHPTMGGWEDKTEGITAGAHKLAHVIHGMIKAQTPYNE
jgi:hypothetical protein